MIQRAVVAHSVATSISDASVETSKKDYLIVIKRVPELSLVLEGNWCWQDPLGDCSVLELDTGKALT